MTCLGARLVSDVSALNRCENKHSLTVWKNTVSMSSEKGIGRLMVKAHSGKAGSGRRVGRGRGREEAH